MALSAANAAPVYLPPRRFNRQRPFANSKPKRNRWARIFSALLLLSAIVIAILAPSFVRAEIVIDPEVGFHGVFQLGRPFPLEIALNNTGRPVEGTLEVRVWKGGATKGGTPYRVNYRREVFLAAQARKTVQLTVDPDFISRPLPVRVTGAKRISFVPHANKDERSVNLAGVWAQTSRVVHGKALAESDGIPVLVETSRGRGRILYLALDVGRPPLSQWSGLPRFLQTLIAPIGTDEPALRTEWNDSVFAQLIVSPSFLSTYVPSGSLLIAMAGYLLGIGVLAWLWQRKRLAPRILLIGFVMFVTAGTALGYVHFSHGGNISDGVLLTSTVLESSRDGFVEAQANLGA